MNIDITGALFRLRIQYTQSQCKEVASDVNFHPRTPITRLVLFNA